MDQRTGLSIDNSNQGSADSFVNDPNYEQPQTQTNNWVAGPGTIELIMPTPLNLKGKFSYYGIKWDDHDIANAHENDRVRIDTIKGSHKLEIRQVNSSMWNGSTIQRFTFNVFVDVHSKFQVESDGSSFNLRVL